MTVIEEASAFEDASPEQASGYILREVPQDYVIPTTPNDVIINAEVLARVTAAHVRTSARFLGRTASSVFNIGGKHKQDSRPHSERVLVPVHRHEHEFIVSQPHPASEAKVGEAPTMLFLPGLMELDKGSAMRLHNTFANDPRFNDRVIATKLTEGVSHQGRLLPINEGHRRRSEWMAVDLLQALPRITQDGPTEIYGTSWGSFLGTEVASQNLSAHPEKQRNITRLALLASAVIALDVDYEELGGGRYFPADMTDEDIRNHLTSEFFSHVPHDLLNMYLNHPEDILESTEALASYIFQPQKAIHRLSAIYGNFRNVQKGFSDEAIDQIAQAHELWVIGGGNDPLVQAQIPYWQAYEKRYPHHVQQTIVKGMGHLLTANAKGITSHLADMEAKSLALAAHGNHLTEVLTAS